MIMIIISIIIIGIVNTIVRKIFSQQICYWFDNYWFHYQHYDKHD